MGVTISKIAQQLNVSTATVSRSLAQDTRVHPATRVRVAKMAMELGYQGRSRRQRTKLRGSDAFHIAVVLQGPGYQGSINAIKLLEGLTAEADGADVAVNIGLAPQQLGGDLKLPSICTDGERCDLAILMGRHHPALVAELVHRCPVVSATTRYAGVPHDHADTGDYWGLYDLTTRVLDVGQRKLAWVGESHQNTGSFEEVRRAGFTQACVQRRIDLSEARWLGPEAFDDHDHLLPVHVSRLIDTGTTCFVCATDRVAFDVLRLLHQWGIAVPGQISVTGFDAVQEYLPSSPTKLTTVDPFWVEVGRAALGLALRRLKQPSAPQMTLTVSPKVVAGETLGLVGS